MTAAEGGAPDAAGVAVAGERPAVIALRNLRKSFDEKTVLDGIDLDIRHGEFLTLLGPSGCGKTTVLRLIAGFEHADAGTIHIDGRDVAGLAPEARHVNTVFQSYALFPHLSVRDNIAFGLEMKKVARGEIDVRVAEAIATVQLGGFEKRMPHELSGGQQQRVALARAIVNRPRVLLLDESLSALDYKLRKQMQGELKALQRQIGITFVFVTHDQEEALAMSDRVVLLDRGRIAQAGSPRDIYERPASLFVARFVGEANIFTGANAVHAGAAAGSTAMAIVVRPEDMRIYGKHDTTPQGQPLLHGRIIERIYKGVTLDSVIELTDGQRVIASEFFDDAAPDIALRPGEEVRIGWQRDREVILPA